MQTRDADGIGEPSERGRRVALKPEPLSAILETFGERAQGSSLADILGALGDRAYGGLLLGLALPALILPPGVVAVLAVPMAILAFQLLLGRQDPVFPGSVAAMQLTQHQWRVIASRTKSSMLWAEQRLRPRISALLGRTHQHWIGAATVLLSLILIIPIPIVHTVAALAAACFGAGLLERDGVAVLLGWGLTLLCLIVLSAMVAASVVGLATLLDTLKP